MNNSFNMITFGNGTIDEDWPACLACAVVKKSLIREGVDLPEVCSQCFERYCWDGSEDDAEVSADAFDLVPLLEPSLTYSEWNKTWTSD